VYPFVRLFAWNYSAPTGRIFMKFEIWVFFNNLSRKFKFHYNLARISGTLHGGQYTQLIISPSNFLGMRNISDNSYRESRNTHFMFNYLFFENRVVYQTMWNYIVQSGRRYMTIWRMSIARWLQLHTHNMKHLLVFHCNNGCINARHSYVISTLPV